MARLILFDLDGTLVDSVDAHARAWFDALREAGVTVPYDRVRSMIGMGADHLLPAISPGLTSQRDPGKAIDARQREIFLTREVGSLRPTRGARALLEALQARGMRTALATSAGPAELDPTLERAGVGDLLERGGSAGDADASKPSPDVVVAALAATGIDASEAAFVGDTRFDIEAGRRAGVLPIALRCGGMDPATLTGAAAVYDDPAALLDELDRSPLVARVSGAAGGA